MNNFNFKFNYFYFLNNNFNETFYILKLGIIARIFKKFENNLINYFK